MKLHRPSWTRWISMTLAACLAIFVWEAVSDEPPAAERPHKVPVAVIDVAKVFKQNRPFQAKMEETKAAIEVFEAEVRKRKADIESLKPKDAAANPPTADESARITKLEAELNADVAIKRQFFLSEEARFYFETYQSIAETVKRIAKDRNIGLVLRYNADEMNPAKRDSVLQGVNRSVVYLDVPDLTDDVLKELNGPKL